MENFGKNEIVNVYFRVPVDKSKKLTRMRNLADSAGQYISNIRYIDTLIESSDVKYKGNEEKLILSNKIVGYRIYPKDTYPPKRYSERIAEHREFMINYFTKSGKQ